ncbi:MAG: hypothetical protein JWM11_5786 [Planctomycetaceae bacterium]|nr:hypothetical protein [Planctomycetaceae bacterium]
MNGHSLNDPLLQSLEARLAACAPSVSAAEQQQMLYQCAFAAGRHAGARTTRRWQAATAALAALVVAVSLLQSIARGRAQDQIAVQRAAQAPASTVIDLPQPAAQPVVQTTERASVQSTGRVVRISLDAWQIPNANDALYSQTLAQHDATDASVNSLRSLTRQFLE